MIGAKLLKLIFAFAVAISTMNSIAQAASLPENKTGQAEASEFFSKWKIKLTRDLEMIKKGREPRKVNKSRRPEIKLRYDKIYFNEKELRLGGSLESWKKIILGKPRCMGSETILCIWDELGLSVGVRENGIREVKYLNIQINISEEDKKIGRTPYPDGTPAEEPLDLSPHNVFPGYLELDGFGIDAETEFWDVRRSASPDRGLDCGLMDCSHPHGSFSKNANIYIMLDSGGRRGRIKVLSLNVIN